MASKRTLTIAINDAPYEHATSTTALRIIDAALRKGHDVNVFAYEGAVSLSLASQKQHANPAKGTTVEQEDHPLTRTLVAALHETAQEHGAKLDWVVCGMCVDERGAGEQVPGPRRGGPADFAKFVQASDNTLVIPTK